MARSRSSSPLLMIVLLVVACQVVPSHQKRSKPDQSNLVLEIAEAGQVKQFPLIQPAWDVISDLWSSFSEPEPVEVEKPVRVVKPVQVVKPVKTVTVKATAGATGKPSKVAKVKPTVSSITAAAVTTTTKKILLPVTLKQVEIADTADLEVATVTAKVLPVTTSSTAKATTRKLKSSTTTTTTTTTTTMQPVTTSSTTLETTAAATTTTEEPTSAETSPTTTITSTGRSSKEAPIPIEYFVKLQQLLLKVRKYNKELEVLRTQKE